MHQHRLRRDFFFLSLNTSGIWQSEIKFTQSNICLEMSQPKQNIISTWACRVSHPAGMWQISWLVTLFACATEVQDTKASSVSQPLNRNCMQSDFRNCHIRIQKYFKNRIYIQLEMVILLTRREIGFCCFEEMDHELPKGNK